MNAALRKRKKMTLKNGVFGKTAGYLRKQRGIKLVTTKARRNHLLSKPNYYTTKSFLNIY